MSPAAILDSTSLNIVHKCTRKRKEALSVLFSQSRVLTPTTHTSKIHMNSLQDKHSPECAVGNGRSNLHSMSREEIDLNPVTHS